jgi:hypothetical protein
MGSSFCLVDDTGLELSERQKTLLFPVKCRMEKRCKINVFLLSPLNRVQRDIKAVGENGGETFGK